MEAGTYAETRFHHDVKSVDSATEALLNTFSAPLPYVGTTLSGLKEYPSGGDYVAVRDTSMCNGGDHYTSWNFQNRVVLSSVFTRKPTPVAETRAPVTPTRVHTTTYQTGL